MSTLIKYSIIHKSSGVEAEETTIACPVLQVQTRIIYRTMFDGTYGILHLQEVLMKILGTWHYTWNNRFVNKTYRYYSAFMNIYNLIFTQNLLFNVIKKWHCKEISLKLAVFYAHHTNAAIVTFLSKGANMREAISFMLRYEQSTSLSEEPALRSTYNTFTKLNAKIGVFVMILPTILGAVVAYTMWALATFKGAETPGCTMIRWLSYQISYPFDVDKYHGLAIVCDLIMCFFALSLHVYNKLINVTLATFQLGQAKVLQEMFKNLDEGAKKLQEEANIGFQDAVEVLVDKCIKRHQQILWFMDLLHKATGTIIFIEFFSSSSDLAVFLIEAIAAHSMHEAVSCSSIFFIIIFQTLPFYWLSNEVYVQSQAVSGIIFTETNWTVYRRSIRQKLLLVMLRCNKPLVFRATAIGDMTLDTYIKIVKSCYTIVTFFNSNLD